MAKRSEIKTVPLPLIVSDEAEKEGKFFNFPEYARTIRDIALNPKNKTPLAISINGRWGSGKTTLMRTIQSDLDERLEESAPTLRKCKTVWFQAWKYNDTDSILAALLHAILGTMRRGTMEEQFKKIFEDVRNSISWWKLPTLLLKTLGYDLSEVVERSPHATKASFYEDFRDTLFDASFLCI